MSRKALWRLSVVERLLDDEVHVDGAELGIERAGD
jgi:hypothetical protein